MRWLVAAVGGAFALVGCGGSAPPTVLPDPPPAPSTVAPAQAPPAKACAANLVWDAKAGACRMFPGGGYGWAGCSMAPAPPNGQQCMTGTHWASCDCVCDAAGTRYDPAGRVCR